MKTLLILTALLATGCETLQERPVKEGISSVMVITNRTYEVENICGKLTTVPPGRKAIACALPGPPCTIWINPMASDEILGHEFRHCLDGHWHK